MILSRVCAGVLLALLVGCGSDSDPDSSAPSDTDAPDAGSPSAPDTGSVPNGADSPAPGAAGLITSDGYETILREVVGLANGEPLDAVSARVRPVLDATAPLVQQAIDTGAASGDGLVFVSFEPRSDDGGPSGEYAFSCENGGTLTVNSSDDESFGGPFVSSMSADGPCAIGDAAYEGSADVGLPFAVRATTVRTFEAFSIARADGDSVALDGEYVDEGPGAMGPVAEEGWSGASLAVVDGGETTRVEGYASRRRSASPSSLLGEEAPSASAEVAFSVAAPWSSNARLDVTVDLALVAPDLSADEPGPYPAQWRSGTLRVVAPDGSGLTLSPETGDPATFSVAFDGDAGEPVVREWADGFQVRCPAPFDCC